IVELGGAGTLMQSIRAIRPGGTISMIGVLSGPGHDLKIPLVVMQQIRLQGVTVGAKDGFDAMLRAIALSGLRPVIDRSFDFSETGVRAAYNHMGGGNHFGKIVLTL
ncbi:MAG: zinc-binding dehydrogenase, partial [Ferrovibrio sp.]